MVIIEIKRDAQDEKNRREAMEFQEIRYAAASRNMKADAIIDLFAEYLRTLAGKGSEQQIKQDPYYRMEAVSKLCEHFADENEELTEDDLQELLNPKNREQMIYLVAAGYEPDVLSACAWLQEYGIDIACFRLRPYKISDRILLERERLIPPPELDEFFVDMRASKEAGVSKVPTLIERQKSDKPIFMKWNDETEIKQSISSWKDALVEGTKRAISSGLLINDLPMPRSENGLGCRRPKEIKTGLHIETNASSESIISWLSEMLSNLGKPKGYLQITTKSGKTIDLPE